MKDLLNSSKNRNTVKQAVALVQLQQANPQIWPILPFIEDILFGVTPYVKADIKTENTLRGR